MEKIVSGIWTPEESLVLSSLVIQEGAEITAPEGKYITLTVDGTTHTIAPGTYTGDVRLTVCDNFTRSTMRFGEETISDFRAAVIVNDGKVLKESSVAAALKGSSATDQAVKDARIDSIEWDFNGILVAGNSDYEISDTEIQMVGDGTDDFVGMGAAIAAIDKANLTINNTKVHTEGIGRGTLYVGGQAEVTMNDCDFSTVSHVPSQEELEAGAKLERMMCPPWSIGLRGNGRTLNLAGDGHLTLNRCHVTSNSWGVLSIDGASLNRMYINDSLIEITGSNGYGFFNIADNILLDYDSINEPGCITVADHSTFNVPYTAALMSLGNGVAEFKNGSVVNSGRFGVFCHRHNGGELKINSGAEFHTDSSCIMVKGSNLNITLDDAVLEPKNGTILQLMDNDDVGMCDDPFLIPVGEVDVRDQRDLTEAIADEDIFVTVSNMTANGNFLNSTTDFIACNRRLPKENPAPEMPLPPGSEKLRGFVGDVLMGAKNLDIKIQNATVNGIISAATAAYKEGLTQITSENCEELSNITQTPAAPINNGVIVSLDENSIWNVTGTSYLTKLTIAEGAKIKGASMTVDGLATEILPGSYTGMITLTV